MRVSCEMNLMLFRSSKSVGTPGSPSLVASKTDVKLCRTADVVRSEEHTSELQSLMRISYAVFCLKKKRKKQNQKQYKNSYKIKQDNNKTRKHGTTGKTRSR